MDKLDYKDFLQKAPIGYAHHRVIFDEANNPIDFIFLEANQKLGEITGLYPNYVIGRKMSDISKNKMATKFDFISYFGNISKNGGSADFEHYAEVSNKWFRVYVTSLKYGYFSLFVSEITSLRDAIIRLDKKKNLLSVFFELSQNLSNFSLEDIISRSLELAEHQTMSTISFHHFVGDDQSTITKQIWSKNTIDNYCHITQSKLHNNVEHGIWGKCISTREPLIINNYDTYRESSHTPSGHPHLTRFCILCQSSKMN
ncbi:MAG TPA: GAF domain-containing protein [Candidatus Kapabacteria bacterium]|nr:GAF domain-containing protein [Candidatus Kapabacteria bacterium]